MEPKEKRSKFDSIAFQNGRIFVHGGEGLNRSAAVIIAYLMRSLPCLLEEAYFYLQVIRPFLKVVPSNS